MSDFKGSTLFHVDSISKKALEVFKDRGFEMSEMCYPKDGPTWRSIKEEEYIELMQLKQAVAEFVEYFEGEFGRLQRISVFLENTDVLGSPQFQALRKMVEGSE